MQFLVICVFLATAVQAAPLHNYVSPVILPKIQYASPDVTVVKQPYVVHQTEPVLRQVFYADPLALAAVSSYVSTHHVAYHHQQPVAAAAAVYHAAPYAHAVNYVV